MRRLMLIATILCSALLMLVLTVSASVQDTPTTPTTDDLTGTRWWLISYGSSDEQTEVITDSEITLEFQSAGSAAGFGGCNSYSGTYTVEDETISFTSLISTEIACLESEVMRQEQAYFEALPAAIRYEYTDDQLTIWYGDDQQLVFAPHEANALLHTWQLVSFGEADQELLVASEDPITLKFGPDHQAGGSAGCNDYGAVYEVADETIAFSEIISTLKLCEAEQVMEQEQQYLEALRLANRYEVSDNYLTIWYGEETAETRLTFVMSDANDLANSQWQLASGLADAETLAGTITLEFQADNQAGGNGGCNTYNTTYTVENDALTFDAVVSTKVHCTDDQIMQQEQAYFAALQAAVRYEVADDELTIWYDDGPNGESSLSFIRMETASQDA